MTRAPLPPVHALSKFARRLPATVAAAVLFGALVSACGSNTDCTGESCSDGPPQGGSPLGAAGSNAAPGGSGSNAAGNANGGSSAGNAGAGGASSGSAGTSAGASGSSGGSGLSGSGGAASGGAASGGAASGGAASGGAAGTLGSGGKSASGGTGGTLTQGGAPGSGGAAQGGKSASGGTGGTLTQGGAPGSGGAAQGGKSGAGGSGPVLDPYAQARQKCVDRVTQLRATKNLGPVPRLASAEACADGQAKKDSQTGQAHSAFGDCVNQVKGWTGAAQNECPGWGSVADTLAGCIDAMWAEGPGGGHYDNMVGGSDFMACGFYTTPAGKVWMVQDFWSN